MKNPICPFFREPCYREDCAAFLLKDKLSPDESGKPFYTIQKQLPYCATLTIYLPMGKELE